MNIIVEFFLIIFAFAKFPPPMDRRSPSQSPTRSFLAGTTVTDVLLDKAARRQQKINLVTVNEEDTVADVVETLVKTRVSCVPVKKSNQTHQYLGIVDMVSRNLGLILRQSILEWDLISHMGNSIIHDTPSISLLDVLTFCIAKLSMEEEVMTQHITERQMLQFLNKPVGRIIDLSGRNFWYEVSPDDSGLKLAKWLSHRNVHRVAVVDKDKSVLTMIAQSDLIHFLYRHLYHFQAKLEGKKIKDWVTKEPPAIVSYKATLMTALKTIWENQVTGVAVVDDEGVLMGSLSASDLKRAEFKNKEEMIQDLSMPVEKFMRSLREKGGIEGQKPKTISLHLEDDVEAALEIVSSKGVHRVFITDESGKPTGVLSLCDIIGHILHDSTSSE